MQATFGTLLKEWRERRNISQLALGLAANVSSRHISFMETGRARPSRSMVMMLCEELSVPRATRNSFLAAAGFSPGYASRSLSDPEMEGIAAAVAHVLASHDPLPAMAFDRHWVVVRANGSAAQLLSSLGLGEGDSLLDAMLDVDATRAAFPNRDEVVRHAVARLKTESLHLGGDPVLEDACRKLAATLPDHRDDPHGPLPAIIPVQYRGPAGNLAFFSMIAQFGSAEDIMLADLKIELMFPADPATRAFFNQS